MLVNVEVLAAEYSIESSVLSRAGYRDNIFLTTSAKESETEITIAPDVKASVKENNWNLSADAKFSSKNYSKRDLDSVDQFLNLRGGLKQERNDYLFASSYTLESNLNTNSADFGVTNKKVDRKTLSLSPTYTWSVSDKMSIATTFSLVKIDYNDSVGTGLTPYQQNTLSSRLNLNLSERDSLTTSLVYSEYESDDGFAINDLFIYKAGMSHLFTERLSGSIIIGASRRNTTNLNLTGVDFFGQPVVLVQELDFKDNGFVLNGGLSYRLERGLSSISASRDVVANSTGGLSELEKITINQEENLDGPWRYSVDVIYRRSSAISSIAKISDREILTLRPSVYYNINRDWRISVTYEYTERKFTTGTLSDSTPVSNMINVGVKYNFPLISTY